MRSYIAPRSRTLGPQLKPSVRQSSGGKKRCALRCVGTLAIVTAISVCGPPSHSAASGQVQCNEVTSVDFQSLSIKIRDREMVQMDHGTGFSSDAGIDGKSRDWKITLVQDDILRPAAALTLRLVRFEANHITGSGAWDHVSIYQCREGELVRVFEERYLYGVEIQRVNDDELLFISGEWMKGDPMCCPSKEKRSAYKWDSKSKKYILIGDSIGAKN